MSKRLLVGGIIDCCYTKGFARSEVMIISSHITASFPPKLLYWSGTENDGDRVEDGEVSERGCPSKRKLKRELQQYP